MTNVHPLDALTFPLQGQQLIEASAGTGKTYTITALYLRLLLGQGDISDKPLGPEQILVVTFTEAATEELRDRIRRRIVEARTAFLDEEDIKDSLLKALKQKCADRNQAVKLLEQAARQMDEAAIFTIHGFCQRMLKQHAFESGSLFDNELTQDDLSLIRSAVLDFWRSTIYPLSAVLTELVLTQCWKGPDQLVSELRGLLNHAGLRLQPDLSELELQQAYDQRMEQINNFKQAWLANEDDLLALIQNSGVNKRSYTKSSLPKWLEQVEQYAASELMEPNKSLIKVLQRFSQSELDSKTASGEPPQHPLFTKLEQLLASEVPVREILLARAFSEVKQRLDRAKKQYQLQTFDDLLTDLHKALTGDQAGLLAGAIRDQFPVAMIDEFQDTDPLQYGIFSTLYADPYNSALIMIGDPKQAIYAFRGADIFTYIQARRSVSDSYTLDTNWRSTVDMVDAVNQLFLSADSPFIYDEDISFQAVKAAHIGDKLLTIQDQPATALTLWVQPDEEILSKTQYLNIYAQATAAEIDRLLSETAQIGDRAVQGSDIAVLVRDRYEAEEIRRALAVYEHPCVYLSNQDSVFNSLEAVELSLLLAAVEEPQNERAVKAALATELLQQTLLQLDQLNHDELAWEAVVTEFSDYRETWLNRGVLPMISQFLHQRNLAAETLGQISGERSLTNILHLAELLQQASSQVEGMNGLIRWFNEQIANPSSGSDDQILRLESERNLVTIVTVHKSKGLEYPIVFLPFASSFRESKTAFYHDAEGGAVLDISAADESLEQADQERLAEELRLLYVALTRSVYSCYVGVSHIKIGNNRKSRLEDSALGYLLLKGEQQRSLSEAVQNLQTISRSITVVVPPDHGAQKDLFAMADEQVIDAQALDFTGRIDRDWRVSSYSALSRHSGTHLPELPGLDLEVSEENKQAEVEVDPNLRNIFTFPKGANAGTFLHSVFEEISFSGYNSELYQQQLFDQLQLAGYEEHWQPVIEQLIDDVLHADLDGQGLKLSTVEDSDRLVEMEFMLSAEGVNVSALETLIRQYDPLSAQAAPLSFEPLTGMLKGFIDLLFRSDGRYYVLDYKSNHLGYEAGCYDRKAVAQSMIEHRYDLQYLLYTLAVHRLLRQRIPDYDYDKHFGGAYYLFLRGMCKDHQLGIFNCRPEKALIEQLDLLFTATEGPLL